MIDNPFEKVLSGLEIKDWVWHHSHSKTSYTAIAKRMMSFFNLYDEKYYMLTLCDNVPVATEVSEKGTEYEISCDGGYGS